MTVLGVPPSRIVLERDALHSDENVYYSLLIANKLGFERLAVASNGPIASGLCGMMVQWGHPCSGIAMDGDALCRASCLRTTRPFTPCARAASRTGNLWRHAKRESRGSTVTGAPRRSGSTSSTAGWALRTAPSSRRIEPITWEKRLQDLSP